jgi:predicted TIM-barrel fold metal-dependent hydrolase
MAIEFTEWQQKAKFGGAKKAYTLLPDPEPRERHYTVISVDDHLVEPPDTFEGRVPKHLEDRAPRVIDVEGGGQAWLYDGNVLPQVGFAAVAGRPIEEINYDPTRFEQMRKGTWDVHARIHDMDLDGIWASLNFPSHLAGFGGARLQMTSPDRELSLAVLRAYNEWHMEVWCGAYPDRLVPVQLPWLHDPVVGAAEIRSNAAKGFHAVTFPEAPEKLGFPSLFTTHWDPIFEACEETGTVLCVHIGSAGSLPATAPDAPSDVVSILFGLYAVQTTVDLLYSLIPVRFPGLKICMSEGGIGWVAGLYDRLDHADKYLNFFGTWVGAGISPAETLRRNFWFCALDDPSSFATIDRIGADRVLVEVDYPHGDSSWPDSQASLHKSLKGLDPEVVAKVTWKNASELFHIKVPEAVQANPNAF